MSGEYPASILINLNKVNRSSVLPLDMEDAITARLCRVTKKRVWEDLAEAWFSAVG